MSEDNDNLGRLVTHMKEKCRNCPKFSLQHRQRTIGNRIEDYKYCPHCKEELVFPYKEKGRRYGKNNRVGEGFK